MKDIPKVYRPEEYEEAWALRWIQEKSFSSKPDDRPPFTIVIPPPNVTGVLHMGHALNNVIQDTIIRYKRMTGFNAKWIPGTDHGGIATQNVVEKMLMEENKTRHDLGREKFLERMWSWKEESGGSIIGQLQRIGCGCDWDSLRFTMDETCSSAVMEAFIRLFNKGLIYRGKYMINWCPRCGTALSDIEVEHEEQNGKLWYIKYPLVDNPEEYLVVATTRPETMLGDTAVAVNPDDERYKSYIGKDLILPLTGRKIKVIQDSFVDPTFGTGAVKVTPAHDPNDFDMGTRHSLEIISVINEKGLMIGPSGDFTGLDRYQARKEIVKSLETEGFLEKIEDYEHSVGQCYRCDTVIEPLLSEQWFLKMRPLADKALSALSEGKTKFIPSSWEKPYRNWLENIHDWCLSRQIWWGHRIPVFYCDSKDCPPLASCEIPESCPSCGGKNFRQDEDVLDTWFSSALWPFSTLGWPSESEELNYYYPTDVLVTGHEILYLWVARMVMMGLELMGEVPFKYVDIHGIIRDDHGDKMSKSKGNVIDPLDIIEKYGTDALRFALTRSAIPGRDIQLSDDDFVGARNFSNKLWNATRLILANLEIEELRELKIEELELSDRWILQEADKYAQKISQAYDEFNSAQAARLAYEFTWNLFCDWYLELAKLRLHGNRPGGEQTQQVALKVLVRILGLLHPIMPFITSQLWEHISSLIKLPGESPIEYNPFKESFSKLSMEKDSENMNLIIGTVSAIRNIRGESAIHPSLALSVRIGADGTDAEVIKDNASYIKLLAKLDVLEVSPELSREASETLAVFGNASIFVKLPEETIKQEIGRMQKRIEELTGQLAHVEKQLSNKAFVSKAPKEIVDRTREKSSALSEEINKLKINMEELKKT